MNRVKKLGATSGPQKREISELRTTLSEMRLKLDGTTRALQQAKDQAIALAEELAGMRKMYSPYYSVGRDEKRSISIAVSMERRLWSEPAANYSAQLAVAQTAIRVAMNTAFNNIRDLCPDVVVKAEWDIEKVQESADSQ